MVECYGVGRLLYSPILGLHVKPEYVENRVVGISAKLKVISTA